MNYRYSRVLTCLPGGLILGPSEQESRSFGGSLPPKCHFYVAPSPAAGSVQSGPPANSTFGQDAAGFEQVPCQDLAKLISWPKVITKWHGAPRVTPGGRY